MTDKAIINLNFDTVICPLCYNKFNKSLAGTPLTCMHMCPHCSAYIDDGYFTRNMQKKLAKHLEQSKGENK